MTTTTLITTLALALAAAPGLRAQAPMTFPVIDPAFRQMLEQMPPTQALNVNIQARNSPTPPNLSGAATPAEVQTIVEQKIAEGQLLEKSVTDAIAAHGGVILTAYYYYGDIEATLSAQSVLDLANDPDILRIFQMPPHSVLSSSFRQMLEQMPPTQLIDYVSVQNGFDLLLDSTLVKWSDQQRIAAGEVLEKPVVDAILAHGGIITYSDYDLGGFLTTLSVQAILDLANDYDIRQIGILSPGGYPAQPTTGQGSAPVPGDVNSDGVVDIRDATLALQALVGAVVLTPQQQLAASCRTSQWPSIACVTAILRLAIGLPSG